MAMRAQMAKAVTKNTKRKSNRRKKNPTMLTQAEDDDAASNDVEETTKFWLGVAEHMKKYRYEREHPVKDLREEKRKTRMLSRMSKRRPSLQLSEKLKLIKPKVLVPRFITDTLLKIPHVDPNTGWKVRPRLKNRALLLLLLGAPPLPLPTPPN